MNDIFMKKIPRILIATTLLFAGASSAQDRPSELQTLSAQIALMEQQLTQLEAENDIENLQRIFGFYFDKNQWTQAADLFTADATVEWGGSGVYVGKEHILAYFQSWGAEGPQQGILNDHMQLQPVITIAVDGRSAQGRWHHFSQEAVHGVSHHWGTGVYENEYRFEDGVWKISKLHLYSTMRTPYDDGWAVTALPRTTPSESLPPDQPPSVEYENYPAVFVPTFHYTNPGLAMQEPENHDFAAAASITAAEASAALDVLENRLGLLEDADAVERLHTIYGYYLQRNQWDDLTGIFTPDGTIEIAQRGVYRGAESVRRNLDLYGVQDELPGTLHNHMQYQPVIHIAPDGQSALMRSRAFSMMGNYGGVGRWMGGTYENIFQKRNGVWMLHKDQQINTYFATYDEGWKDLAPRPPPGITEANPPDEPPSLVFEMYPSAYLPAYHYVNPVTGRE
ncbi:MAG: hypothetical protein RLZZ227_2678 [Pseudomonadota bacterium]|jgi:hypothetical protein